MKLRTQRGAGMYGSTSVRCRIISNEVEPDPMMTPACSTIVGTPESSRIRPTSVRERRCRESRPVAGCSPPRYTIRLTPCSRAEAATLRAIESSIDSKSSFPPIECTR